MAGQSLDVYQGAEPFLFVSYAHADDAVVFPDMLRLHQAGCRIWYDKGINPAEEWPRVISQRLIASKLVLVYLSPRSLASKWVPREIRLADHHNKELLPVYLEPLQLPDDLELQIGHVQALHRHTLSPDEYFQQLSGRLRKDIMREVPDLRQKSEEEHRARLLNELAMAAEVQKSMLPETVPSVPGYSFWATMEPAYGTTAGGDLYDFQTLPTGEILVLVADVSGKGIPAAVGMTALAGIITMAQEGVAADLAALIQAVNRAYCRRMNRTNMFATLLAVALDPRTHRLRVVSAGHGPSLIRRRQGTVQELVPQKQGGLPLGILEDSDYETGTAELGPGDAVFISSDGIGESMSPRRELYAPRLPELLARTEPEAAKLGEAALADVKAFTGGVLQDDTTVVCFSRNLA
jgi:serine phosphatase RsbU (regulator of sigma subunit)